MSDALDTIVEGGLFFDGEGAAPDKLNVGIRDGKIAALSRAPLPAGATKATLPPTPRPSERLRPPPRSSALAH